VRNRTSVIIVTVIVFLVSSVPAGADDKTDIETIIKASYFNGAFNDLDTQAMRQGFHPEFAILRFIQGQDGLQDCQLGCHRRSCGGKNRDIQRWQAGIYGLPFIAQVCRWLEDCRQGLPGPSEVNSATGRVGPVGARPGGIERGTGHSLTFISDDACRLGCHPSH